MDRTALVTGANRGIGLAIAHGLATLGHPVWLGSRELAAGEEAAAALRRAGLDATAVRLDLGDPATLDAAVGAIEAAGRTVGVLVNNAGVLHQRAVLELSDEEIAESIAVHVTGPIRLVRRVVPRMTAAGFGRIVNLSSDWGSFAEGLGGPGAYGITKAALNALTARLARELPGSIKVNAMCPGWVRTRMGGEGATRTPAEGADTAIWLATLPDDGPTGGFFRERRPLGW